MGEHSDIENTEKEKKQKDPVIELENIVYSYNNGPVVFDGLSFSAGKEDKIGLVGHNGSGKSTLLNVISGLVKPESGTIRIFGQEMTKEADFQQARKKLGYLFQNADDQLFSPTVLEDVAFGPLNMGYSAEESRQMSIRALEDLGLAGFEDRITHKLSGGEKKLVSLATVLVMKPVALLLDEPTTGLDRATFARIIEILNSIRVSCIIVSHEFDFLEKTTSKIFSMDKGKIRYSGESEHLHTHFHTHPMGETPHSHNF